MKILAIALLCMWVRGAVAQEERAIDNFAGVGVRAMGMGGAFVGVADDFTAMYWNPAGLAQMQQREVQVSFLRNSRANDSIFNGTPGRSELTNTRFGSLGFVYPYPVYRGSLVLAAGLTRIKDFDWNLNLKGDDQGLAANHALQHEGELALAGVSAAIDVSPAVSLGATLGLVSGEDEAVSEFDWADLEDVFDEQRFRARDTFTDEYKWTPYAVLGAMLRTPRDEPRYRLGATFSTGGTHKIRYVFRGSSSDEGYNSVEYDDGTVQEFPDEEWSNTYELALPFEFGVGASAEALPGLTLAGSLHLAEWSQSEYKGADDYGLRADTSFEKQYRDVLRYHLGVEYQVPVVALDLRAGYFVDPVPFIGPRDPGSDDPPIRIEEDRRFITLGAGILIDEAMQIDLAWVRGAFKQVEEYSSEFSDNILSEDYAINRLVVGMGYNF
ncbi:MAG: outer membrane protein transport protein [Gemmatimonadota bacterium]|nr:outer membrane protein transport protein [Gemmatimonadota bacterium]